MGSKRRARVTIAGASTLVMAMAFFGCAKPAAEQPPPATAAQEKVTAPRPAAPALAESSAAADAKSDEAQPAKAPEPEAPPPIPTTCEGSPEDCFPPRAFAEAVCHGRFPDLAIYLFAKGTPWQRAYVKAQHLEPVNMYDGARSDRWLEFGEEVLVLKRHGGGDKNKVQVSGPTDLDILRFDGTCATIRQEMVVRYMPGAVKVAPVVWKYLDPDIQEALLKDRGVSRASEKERPACKGSTQKNPAEPCMKAMTQLSDAIGVALRLGAVVPAPDKVPNWKL
jgi:hypothetical protein